MMTRILRAILILSLTGFVVSCAKKLGPGSSFVSGLGSVNPFGEPGGLGGEKKPEPGPVEEPAPPNKPPGGYGKGAGCDGEPGSTCLGGYDNDAEPVDFPVKVILASSPGRRLTNDPIGFSKKFIGGMNKYYVHEGHRYMNLVVDESQVIEDDGGLSDSQLISKYAGSSGKGYLIMILVDNIPGGTAGYVRNSCALVERGEAWTVFEFGLVNAGVVEHESNHIFCFPHTSSQNGGTPSFYLSGYNPMEDVLKHRGAFKKAIDPMFNIYIDRQNRSNAKVEHDGMIYDTHNLMYYSVLRDRPALFTTGSTGFHYSYSHLIDYYYWKFVKTGAKQ